MQALVSMHFDRWGEQCWRLGCFCGYRRQFERGQFEHIHGRRRPVRQQLLREYNDGVAMWGVASTAVVPGSVPRQFEHDHVG